MRIANRLAAGVAIGAVAAISLRVISQDAPAPQPAAANTAAPRSLTPLRGLDVSVRSEGETDFSDKTQRVPVEAFRDEDFGTLTYIASKGSVAVLPQPPNYELRHLPFDRTYETFRFSPIVGITWRLNLRTERWQWVEESSPIGPGDYDLDVFQISDSSMVVMRIDQLTGKTWTLVSTEGKPDRWQEIAEPTDQPAPAAAK